MGTMFISTPKTGNTYPHATSYRNSMCPSSQANSHPAYSLLAEWSQLGCPAMTRKQWTQAQIIAAIERGPHQSATTPKALAHFAAEAKEKVAVGQARIILWDDIKDNLPPELKILPIATIPQKSKAVRSILDISYNLRLKDGSTVPSVNDTLEKSGQQGVMDQTGHTLQCIIHTFASPLRTTKYSWLSTTSRMDSGGWIVTRVRDGISPMSFPNLPVRQSKL
jgi:hypothetical protein